MKALSQMFNLYHALSITVSHYTCRVSARSHANANEARAARMHTETSGKASAPCTLGNPGMHGHGGSGSGIDGADGTELGDIDHIIGQVQGLL